MFAPPSLLAGGRFAVGPIFSRWEHWPSPGWRYWFPRHLFIVWRADCWERWPAWPPEFLFPIAGTVSSLSAARESVHSTRPAPALIGSVVVMAVLVAGRVIAGEPNEPAAKGASGCRSLPGLHSQR